MELLGKMRYGSVIRALMEQFQVGRSTACRTITLARVYRHEELERHRPFREDEVASRAWRLLDLCEERGDLRSAVGAIGKLIAIYRLGPDQVNNVTVNNVLRQTERWANLTDEQIDAIEKLEETHDAPDETDGGAVH